VTKIDLKGKNILVTGSAGFIGFHLSKKLLADGYNVIGIDNINDYYDVNLKYSRLKQLEKYENFKFIKGDLADAKLLAKLFDSYNPNIVVNLAAQAGVRYSIDNPQVYIDSNIIGFYNILELCRNHEIEHLVFASSSSVYGMQDKVPFSTEDNVDHPVSLYAATKKSNELFAFTYSHLYNIPVTGIRPFTVYGPFGRPDMAYFTFTNKILSGETIKVFNNGDMLRDFTYIDDMIEGIIKIMVSVPKENEKGDRYKIYNIGNNRPEKLAYFIEVLENELGVKAKKEFLPMQPGDVYKTYADMYPMKRDFDFVPTTSIEEGIHKFVLWYKKYFNIG
jgi:UDP-glucuronate 4-epimerase